MTTVARSKLPAPPPAGTRPARETCDHGRALALRTAIAEGRYCIDSQAIAAKLIAALSPHFQPATRPH